MFMMLPACVVSGMVESCVAPEIGQSHHGMWVRLKSCVCRQVPALVEVVVSLGCSSFKLEALCLGEVPSLSLSLEVAIFFSLVK